MQQSISLPQAPARTGAAAAVLCSSTAYLFGGRDETGALSDQLLALDLADPSAPWRQVGAAVKERGPGPRAGHATLAYADQLWVVGGRGADGSRLDDAWRFNPATQEWCAVGAATLAGRWPSRPAASGAGELLALHGGLLIALGQLGQDENRDPAPKRTAVAALANGKTAASAHASAACTLSALDLLSGAAWRELPVSGHPGFDRAEALVVTPGGLLVGSKRDVAMQVATLDIGGALRQGSASGGSKGSSSGRAAVGWSALQARGHVPTARMGCAAVLLEGDGGAGPWLVITGGVLCSPAVKGVVTGDVFCLDLDTCTWTKLPPAALGAGSGAPFGGGPRFGHTAVALPREQGGGALMIGGSRAAGEHASRFPLEWVFAPAAAPDEAPAQLQVPADADAAAPPCALVPPHDLRPYYLSESLSDVEIIAGGVPPLPAHMLVLAISPRFRELMEQAAASGKGFDTKEGRWKLHVADVYPEILKLLLAYLYARLDAVPPRDAPTLFGAAARYGLPGLKAECLGVLCATTTLENVSTHVLLAHEERSPELMAACVSYAAASQERFAQLVATPGYLHLTEASPRVAQAFLSQACAELLRKG
ncbi:hypothetical protein Rsub_01706 [Raphidocelis subcapitata]|uniref:BTB domain-containing protein n=1 Tax=Raphidocelis subcapitata TaxID=307507 RepID=A0A2V0NVF8_9CHLO|nr:hypothetical protein Rsub_01706 [Raphidocelis subcapitata]|eukprot:GBF88805.1 hypothetical protein Rsub_01706 [Raphidocelis subcapitata]